MMKLIILLLLCTPISFSFAAKESLVQCLSNKLPQDIISQTIYQPNTVNYTSVLQAYIRNSRFNTSTTPKPTVIITPMQEYQVQLTVYCAKKSEVQLKIRSGGHDYEGLSYVSKTPFAVLDMFHLKSININLPNQTAWVQAGATLGELYYRIWEKTKVHAFPSGVCLTVGLGGHFSGGGYGNMLRKYGLSVDNIIDARIVDARGRILNRKGMGEDLFWAIRGGGGASFGVILAYKIKLVSVPPVVTVFNVKRTLEENATDIIHRWQYVAPKIENDLFIRINLYQTAGKNPGQKTVTASIVALFLGDAKRLLSAMESKFPELGVKKQDCKEMSWIKSTLFFSDFKDGTPETALLTRKTTYLVASKMKSDYVKSPIPRKGLVGILKRMVKAENIVMQWNPYGGRMSEIPESAVPFPHRAGNIFKIQYLINWQDTRPAAIDSNINKIRKFYEYMTPFVSKNPRGAFLNYRDIDIGSLNNSVNAYSEAKVYGVKYFKGNFDRLVKVKTMVDPENFFRYEQGIPPLRSL